jgi:hypothetical protein
MRMRDLSRAAGVDKHFAIRKITNRNLLQPLVLIPGRNHLQLARQVEPQLQRVRRLAAMRHLAVEHAMPRGHPLHIARPENPVRAGMVAMLQRAFEDNRHRLHPAVRVLLEALRRGKPVLAQEQERRGLLPALRADDQLLVMHLRAGSLRYDALDASDWPHRSLKRWILPVAVLGSSLRNWIQRGYL